MKLSFFQRLMLAFSVVSVIVPEVQKVINGGSGTTPDAKVTLGGRHVDISATAGPGNANLPNIDLKHPFVAFGAALSLAEELDVDYTALMAGQQVDIDVASFKAHGAEDKVTLHLKLV